MIQGLSSIMRPVLRHHHHLTHRQYSNQVRSQPSCSWTRRARLPNSKTLSPQSSKICPSQISTSLFPPISKTSKKTIFSLCSSTTSFSPSLSRNFTWSVMNSSSNKLKPSHCFFVVSLVHVGPVCKSIVRYGATSGLKNIWPNVKKFCNQWSWNLFKIMVKKRQCNQCWSQSVSAQVAMVKK